MKIILCAAVSLGAIAYAGSAALADGHTLGADNNSVTFSEISLADGSPDDGTCEKRYGTGYKTADSPNTTADNPKKTTEEGHDIVISSTGGTIGDGILSIENEYEIIFPSDEKKEAVDVKMFATGLIGSGTASGVFSDGTCRGEVTIQAAGS
ncbi:hypothetical protein [Pseudovibrio sp. Tun.PSC04-5.I4]|uniref:hypothetical protein n=1 Tax=Pseudovibrio sp. Tun.PSC04-5.I4 TaxID=1798213 RepID=UPI00088B480C|nr:hypothetical protein [Pseudovibrio sp. Tun.PSC04-5.I4]SDR06975.1 hypothetical protein SAMN04515695_2596 [Pseudovibrio sp. Tun.PSC04-5.I4]